ncbi:SET domain-containing protein [Planctomonas sp. JC2975]|uniref:SET domain-containing protein n=1 Tax=Planctomonas sp. JC2975 TaxID=2729626 RepID=UPI001476015C|nr:SET domain-containing protein [Planctomonas sp. JC2975]NNC12910.1 SET domain-containing protein [Planctomonas sp. JC2975]
MPTEPTASAVPIASWISPKAHKGAASDIAGRGLFALEAIASGEVVAVKGGHVVTTAELHALPQLLQNSDIQIADELHLVALTDDEYEPVMLFLNHSCAPNVGIDGNVLFVAMRDVAAGEELTTDYALFDDYDGSMECHCGVDACRHVIDGRDWRLPELQKRYSGWFSSYLQRRIDAAG